MGPKLITPVQYESGFDGLNEVRPLSLDDEVRCDLSIPFCNLQTVSRPEPADGRFLRCTDRGVLIAHKPESVAEDFEDSGDMFSEGRDIWWYDFSQKVRFVSVLVTSLVGTIAIAWCTAGGYIIMEDVVDEWVFFPFTGNRFHYLGIDGIGQEYYCRVIGFY